MMNRLLRATAARLRSARDGDEDTGFAMIFTLVVITMVTTSVTAMLVVTASEIKPAQNTVYSASATAAAQAGVQAYYALLNNNSAAGCATATQGSTCSALATNPTLSATLTGADGSGSSAYYASLVNTSSYPTDGFARIYSVGCSGAFNASNKCVAPNVGKAIVTDIKSPAGFTTLAYFSTYETVGSSLIGQQFPARTIALPNPTLLASASQSVAALLGGGTNGSVSWVGADTPDQSANSPAVYNATQQICDSEWYNDLNFDIASGGLGRGTVTPLLPSFDWTESGTVTKAVTLAGVTTNVALTSSTHNGQCQVALTTSNAFTGPVQSRDAFYLSGNPSVTKAASITGPGVTTGWGGTANSTPTAPAAPGTYHINDTRDPLTGVTSSFVFNGFGASDTKLASSGSSPVLTHNLPALEPSATYSPVNSSSSGPQLSNTCVYYGPTRILLNGDNTATVTSPMTLANATNPCYASSATKSLINPITYPIDPTKGTAVTASAPGVVGAVVALNSNNRQPPTFIVRNVGSSSAWAKTTGDGAGLPTGDTSVGTSPIFAIRDNSAAPSGAVTGTSTTISAIATGLWDNSSAVVAGCVPIIFVSTCQANTSAYFDSANKASNSASPTIASLQAIAASTTQATVQTTCSTLMTDLAAWNKNLKSPSTTPTSTSDYYYAVSPSTCAGNYGAGSGSGSGTCASKTQTFSPSAEPLYQANTGTATATCTLTGGGASTTYTVTRYSGVCTGVIVLGACVGVMSWGNALPQFSIAVASTGTTAYSNWSTTADATSTFPLTSDRSVYTTYNAAGTNGPGDAYIGGQLGGAGTQPLDVITENDTIVTGSITPNDATGTTVPGSNEPSVALVSGQNVRVYHPVRCVTAATSSTPTTAGFCPNDTTGLFNYTTLPAPLGANHPALQYTNLQQDQTQPGTTCAGITIDGALYGLGDTLTPTSSISNGSLTTDNPDRGANCGNLTLNGGVFQQHRGTIGTILEDSTSTGYSLIYNYDANLKAKLSSSWLPPINASGNGAQWTIISTSSVPVS